jgi:hypothetical protein
MKPFQIVVVGVLITVFAVALVVFNPVFLILLSTGNPHDPEARFIVLGIPILVITIGAIVTILLAASAAASEVDENDRPMNAREFSGKLLFIEDDSRKPNRDTTSESRRP